MEAGRVRSGRVLVLSTLLPWGLLARVGERLVIVLGLAGAAAALVGTAGTSGFGQLTALLALAGALGASVNAASGRAVMGWFGAEERGLALGIRQTAIPIGAAAAAASLPWLASTGGTRLAFFALAGSCLAGAGLGGAFLRDAPAAAAPAHAPEERPSPLRDPRMWLLAGGSSLYLVAQISAWSGSRRMPRKMSGIAIRTIEPSMVASNTPRVVFESPTHL